MRTPSNRWLVAGVAAIAACLMTAGCTSNPTTAAAPPSQPASTGADAPTSAPASDSPAPAASSPTSIPVGVQNLLVSPSVRRELTAAYESFMRFTPSGIAGTAPGSVYYAHDAATGSYWAMATFQPSKAALHSSPDSAMYNVLVDMQDGGNQGLFTRTSGGVWQVERAGVPPQCQIVKFFPKAVIRAWALNLPRCPAAG